MCTTDDLTLKFWGATMKWKLKKKQTWNWKWTAFLAGLGAGTAIGMVVAPKRGAELRDDLQAFARDSYEQGRHRIEPMLDMAREKVQPAVDELRNRIEPVLDDIDESVSRVLAQATEVRDSVADKVSDMRANFGNGGLMSILNEWSHEKLIEIDGIGPVLASKIIHRRPYESEQELIDSKELPPSAIESLRKAA